MKSRKIFRLAVVLLLAVLMTGSACAEFDAGQYSYDELAEIRQQVDARMAELEREYALANADRTIAFEEPEQVLFPGRTISVMPVVTILKDGAPAKTQFVWSSSAPEIASVSRNGTVTPTGRGDAVITAAAADNEYLTASYIVHSALQVEKITVWGPEEPLVLGTRDEDAGFRMGFGVEPEDAYFQQVTWTVSDENIATVDEDGLVTAIAPGKVTVTALTTEPQTTGRRIAQAACDVIIRQAVTGLETPQVMDLNAGERTTMAVTVQPENASDRTIVYTSSNPEIATVDRNGAVHALACGECDILCEAADGYGASANVHVRVTRKVAKVTIPEKQISLPIGGAADVEVLIEPEDATDKGLIWTSTNVFVARAAGGKVEAVGQGDCVITCTTTDGSNISASVKVHVPVFSIEGTAYTVTEKQGLTIPVKRNLWGSEIELLSDSPCFAAILDGETIRIDPITAGTGTITLRNPDAPEDTVQIQITIENSAVFNQTSYPAIPYMELVRVPDLYEGAQVSIYGKVLHIAWESDGTNSFMVGTAGEKYTDQVIRVQSEAGMMPGQLGSGDMVTVYGLFHLDHAYSEVLQAETMVPGLKAEKIVIE